MLYNRRIEKIDKKSHPKNNQDQKKCCKIVDKIVVVQTSESGYFRTSLKPRTDEDTVDTSKRFDHRGANLFANVGSVSMIYHRLNRTRETKDPSKFRNHHSNQNAAALCLRCWPIETEYRGNHAGKTRNGYL